MYLTFQECSERSEAAERSHLCLIYPLAMTCSAVHLQIFGNLSPFFWARFMCITENILFEHCRNELSDCNCQHKSKIFADIFSQQERGGYKYFACLQYSTLINLYKVTLQNKLSAKCNLCSWKQFGPEFGPTMVEMVTIYLLDFSNLLI